MIADKDRSKYFGGSDAHYVTGSWSTKTFKNWWLVKIGLFRDELDTKAMRVGTMYEHKILDAVGELLGVEIEKDKQVIIESQRLRVNYDGTCGNHIYEVKTYSGEEFKLSPNYRKQAQVEMLALRLQGIPNPTLSFLAYKVGEAEYRSYFEDIDPERITEIPIEYDEEYINEYLTNLDYLCWCLDQEIMPNEDDRPNKNKSKSQRKSKGKR